MCVICVCERERGGGGGGGSGERGYQRKGGREKVGREGKREKEEGYQREKERSHLPDTVHPLQKHRSIVLDSPVASVSRLKRMTKPQPLLLNQYLHRRENSRSM